MSWRDVLGLTCFFSEMLTFITFVIMGFASFIWSRQPYGSSDRAFAEKVVNAICKVLFTFGGITVVCVVIMVITKTPMFS